MKLIIMLGLLVSGVAAIAQQGDEPVAETASDIGQLPNDRVAIPVADGAPNPYGLPTEKTKEETSTKRQYSQEDLIREKLRSLPVTGIIGNGKKVMLHDIILEEGEMVAPVLPGQTEVLLVKEITKDAVFLEWIEQSKKREARRMEIPINLDVQVESLIKGQKDNSAKLMDIVRMPEEEE